jgi:hypothetical protein
MGNVNSRKIDSCVPSKSQTIGAAMSNIKIESIIFPWIPRTTENLISVLFWHSMIFTISTPIFRLLSDHWKMDLIIHIVMSAMAPAWVVDLFSWDTIHYSKEGEEPMPGTGPVKGIDLAFGIHAGCSLLWLLVGYIQIVHVPRTKKMHRLFGYISLLSFIMHTFGSLFSLYMDIVRHQALSRIILMDAAVVSSVNVFKAICLAIYKPKGWLKSHQDLMVGAFMISIQGAGPIRMIAQVQVWTGTGPVVCQNAHGGMATDCMWPYVFRMLWTSTLMMYTRSLYCKMRKDEGLTREYQADALVLLVIVVAFVAYSRIPDNEKFLSLVLGEARSFRGTATVIASGILRLDFFD